MAFYKYLLLLLLGIAFAVSFMIIFVFNDDTARTRVLESPFSMIDNSLKVEPERALFEAVIKNSGDTPINVEGFGFLDKSGNPSAGCIFVSGVKIMVPAGQFFNVKIECTSTTNPNDLDFYIINSPQGNSMQLSSELGVVLPNIPDLNSWMNNYLNSANSNPTGTFPTSGSGGNTGNTNSPPTSDPNIGHIGSTNVPSGYSSNLEPPLLIGTVALNDSTPTVNFLTLGNDCRMDVIDKSYFDMSPLNLCTVETGDGSAHCTLSNQLALPNGPNNLYIACVSSDQYNDISNNLDIPLNMDFVPPIISNVYPSEGNYYSSSNKTLIHIQGQVNGASSCSATLNSGSPVNINSNDFLFPVDLRMGYNFVTINCNDVAGNNANYNSGDYHLYPLTISSPAPVGVDSNSQIQPSKSSSPIKKSSGGGGSSKNDVPQDIPPKTDLSAGADAGAGAGADAGADVSGASIQNFSSSKFNFIDSIITWVKRFLN